MAIFVACRENRVADDTGRKGRRWKLGLAPQSLTVAFGTRLLIWPLHPITIGARSKTIARHRDTARYVYSVSSYLRASNWTEHSIRSHCKPQLLSPVLPSVADCRE
jgi:hypothetical protein